MKEPETLVNEFINEQFVREAVTVEDFSLFPFGKLLTDKNGETMVIFFDLLSGNVEYRFEDK